MKRGNPMQKNKVISHLKGDIKTFKKEAKEDRELMKSLKHKKHEAKESKKHEKKEHKKDPKKKTKGRGKIKKVMHEFKLGELHSGSKKGPVVTNPKQGIAIAISEARKAGAKIPKKRK